MCPIRFILPTHTAQNYDRSAAIPFSHEYICKSCYFIKYIFILYFKDSPEKVFFAPPVPQWFYPGASKGCACLSVAESPSICICDDNADCFARILKYFIL